MRNKFKADGDIKDSSEFISASDVWAFCRDNDLSILIQKEEV